MKKKEIKDVLEAALLSAGEPLSVTEMKRLFGNRVGADDIKSSLEQLKVEMTDRPVELVEVATGWRFQTRPQFAEFIERLTPEKAPKYSRAVMETLAIVSYRQPVTRGDIEEIRGVSVSSQIVKTLEDRGWIDVIGHKEVIGRPALFGTTKLFLDDLGLQSLKDLPPIDDLAQNDETIDMFNQKLVEISGSAQPGEGDESPAEAAPESVAGGPADIDNVDGVDETTDTADASDADNQSATVDSGDPVNSGEQVEQVEPNHEPALESADHEAPGPQSDDEIPADRNDS